ncbi:MAG: hypothetical protein V4629_12580 [Pseudomonadota bacterium]
MIYKYPKALYPSALLALPVSAVILVGVLQPFNVAKPIVFDPIQIEFIPHVQLEIPKPLPIVAKDFVKNESKNMVGISDISSWEMGKSNSGEMPSFELDAKIMSFDVVHISQESTYLPSEGDQVNLPMLQGETAQAVVKSSEVNPNGDYSWRGYIKKHGEDYPVVMTYGKNSVFATITTPEGSYSMESVNGVGWLYKNPAESELSQYGTKDYLEVDGSFD